MDFKQIIIIAVLAIIVIAVIIGIVKGATKLVVACAIIMLLLGGFTFIPNLIEQWTASALHNGDTSVTPGGDAISDTLIKIGEFFAGWVEAAKELWLKIFG